MVNIVLSWDTYEPRCFKLDMMLGMTVQADSSLNELDVYSRSQEIWAFSSHFVGKLHEAVQVYGDGWLCKDREEAWRM